jgi:hypothetical protein
MAKQTGVELQDAWAVRRQEREKLWRRHVGAWRGSGLSQAEYCRQQNLTPADLSWWKHELLRRDGQRGVAQAEKGETERPRFVPLQVTAERMLGGCELELRDGRRLRISSGVDPRWVVELAAALEHNILC